MRYDIVALTTPGRIELDYRWDSETLLKHPMSVSSSPHPRRKTPLPVDQSVQSHLITISQPRTNMALATKNGTTCTGFGNQL
jgi:hypothetical protein